MPAAGERIREGDVVVVAHGDLEQLLLAALERVGADGAVIVVDCSADVLEALRARCPDSRVSYLIGDTTVLPLPDRSADVVLAVGDVDDEEVGRVLRDPARPGALP